MLKTVFADLSFHLLGYLTIAHSRQNAVSYSMLKVICCKLKVTRLNSREGKYLNLTTCNLNHHEVITKDEVKHIAKLARLNLTDEELEKFSIQLSAILDHAKMLNEVNTDGVEPISQITGLMNVIFEDETEGCDCSEELLNQSPQSIQDNMIKVKNVF